MERSPKQLSMERKILRIASGKAVTLLERIFADDELQAMQDYANYVSIKRLGFNDHGPVHMRTATYNALKMFNLLREANVKFTLEEEGIGASDDSLCAVVMGSLFHDLGMTITRSNHEFYSFQLALPYIQRFLDEIYSPDQLLLKKAVQSVTLESIIGHMATTKINSLEAGLVLIADGSDMEKGRARIPTLLSGDPKPGDIHRTSAGEIENVIICKGEEKPIKIIVKMNASVGLFQIEEVFYPKINFSPVKKYIELYAGVKERELLKYL